jgi:hypothetical protein
MRYTAELKDCKNGLDIKLRSHKPKKLEEQVNRLHQLASMFSLIVIALFVLFALGVVTAFM